MVTVKKESSLVPEVFLVFGDHNVPIAIFESVSQFYELIKYILQQTNLYAKENGRDFVT